MWRVWCRAQADTPTPWCNAQARKCSRTPVADIAPRTRLLLCTAQRLNQLVQRCVCVCVCVCAFVRRPLFSKIPQHLLAESCSCTRRSPQRMPSQNRCVGSVQSAALNAADGPLQIECFSCGLRHAPRRPSQNQCIMQQTNMQSATLTANKMRNFQLALRTAQLRLPTRFSGKTRRLASGKR